MSAGKQEKRLLRGESRRLAASFELQKPDKVKPLLLRHIVSLVLVSRDTNAAARILCYIGRERCTGFACG